MKKILSLVLVLMLAISSFALAEEKITVFRSGSNMPAPEDDAILPNIKAAMNCDVEWAILEPMLPGQRGQWGGVAEDNRRFINGVFWILRTGAPWRDLPPDYGKWGSVHQRFRRWRDKGMWEKILEALIDDPDYEWLMIDASHCKVHPHAAGAKGGNQDMSRTKGGSTQRFTLSWIRLVCRSERLSQKAPELIARRLYILSRE